MASTKRMRAIASANKKRWEEWRENHRTNAIKEFPRIKSNPLFIAGIMLYWGEGDSKVENGNVRLTNTNGNIMRLFTQFLLTICEVPLEKIKGAMILYPDLHENTCKDFWSSAT